ncbi:hypothetical protein C5613_29670 [Rhodococcus opacus]|uniref:Uncharacterized protein n=1 Tax=Rhodococcus opacus TaxID=37919 RepID=A0A2S8IYC5_RHOOP|nr:hypothetical protein C5613_29670 [Rhodococcus opacus]
MVECLDTVAVDVERSHSISGISIVEQNRYRQTRSNSGVLCGDGEFGKPIAIRARHSDRTQ